MEATILEDEKLYRAVKPFDWYIKDNRVSSSLFKVSNGVSVDRDGNRDGSKIISSFVSRFGFSTVKAVVYVTASYCFALPTKVVPDPIKDPDPIKNNEFHSLIHDINTIPLRESKARKLAKNCTVVHCA